MRRTMHASAEKPALAAEEGAVSSDPESLELPYGWKYKVIKIGSYSLPWYASPTTQLLLVAFVCFLCPGMFNALGGLGGGGQVDVTTADDAGTALNSTFSVVGFFAGTIINKLGIKTSLSFGGLGYCIYVASFLCYNHTENRGFVIFAGALLGACAGILWTAQGAIMLAYPPEKNKGRFISWFWMIFNFGGVIGGLIPLGQNIHVRTASNVTDGTYVGFVVLTGLGAALAWTLVDSSDVIREDGSKVIIMASPTWKSELLGLWETLRAEPYIVLLFPMFWSSNWFYIYQFNSVNAARFDTRTRALNSVLYWGSQIFGALIFGYCLDISKFSRPARARGAWVALFVFTMAIWGGGYAWQVKYDRASVKDGSTPILDWESPGYVGPMFLYMFYGFYDAAWQTTVYWMMGALTNNGRRLANYVGFYKGIQSAGAAVMSRCDALGMPYMSELASNWGLLSGSLLLALPLILMRITDHVELVDDLRLSDKTFQDVAPQIVTEVKADEEKVFPPQVGV